MSTGGEGLSGCAKCADLNAERARLRAELEEMTRKEKVAQASFSAAKLANVLLGKRMGKLERELSAFAESIMRDKDNVKASEPAPKAVAAASTNSDANGAPVDPPIAPPSPDPASDLHDRISALESELRSTRRALDIVVEAFGRDAVVDKLQQARKPHTSSLKHSPKRHTKHAAENNGEPPTHATGAATLAPVRTPPDDMIVPSFVQDGVQSGLAVRKSHPSDESTVATTSRNPQAAGAFAQSLGTSPAREAQVKAKASRHGQPRGLSSPRTSPFATAPREDAPEFSSFHPLVPLAPNPVPVADYLAEFRQRGAGAGARSLGATPVSQMSAAARPAASTATNDGSNASPPRSLPYGAGSTNDASVASSDANLDANLDPSAGNLVSPSKGGQASSERGGNDAVSSYVKLSSPGSAQAPGRDLVERVRGEVGSFISTFHRRRTGHSQSPPTQRRAGVPPSTLPRRQK